MKRIPLQVLPPVFLVMILDLLFTMIGQPSGYWNNFSLVNEGSPLGFSLLSKNPIIFIIVFILYLILVYFIFKKAPISISLTVAILLFVGHAWGSSSWLPRFYNELGLPIFDFYKWWIVIVYFFFLSVVTSFFLLRIKN